ncbi:MAG: single-stranded DNA-binding protein [Chitinophagales bacterium]|nr:single-stranded DNA-binding protein [Chitinophagales bacterium]
MNTIKNQVQLIGHLGKDPEVRKFESGKVRAAFSLATTDSYVNQNGEKVKDTQWHNVVVWGQTAKVVEKYLHKGSEVAIQGKLMYRNYEDKDGQKRYMTEIMANELMLMDKQQN